MHCENLFCVYWSEDICILDKISIDRIGMCSDCIFVDLDPTLLQIERRKILDSFEERYKEWEERDKANKENAV